MTDGRNERAPRPTVAMQQARYSRVAIILHWGIALMILYNLASGLLHERLPAAFFALHETSGISILALSVIRIGWRLTHRPPPFMAISRVERGLAHGVHALLYTGMLVLPLTGWALVSATPPLGSPGAGWYVAHRPAPPPGGGVVPQPHRILVFGNVELPGIGPIREIGRLPRGVLRQRNLHEAILTTHLLGGWVMLALFLFHVAGACKHQFLDRQPEFTRMGLGRRWPSG